MLMCNGLSVKSTQKEGVEQQIFHFSLFTLHFFLYLCTDFLNTTNH